MSDQMKKLQEFADVASPEHGDMGVSAAPSPSPEAGHHSLTMPAGTTDKEGAMAKADLYKLANYSHKLFQQIHEDDQFESWVQAKITKAADYIASVYHYLEYEMKFSEYGHHLDNSDTLSESQKTELKNKLMEAKMKVKEIKKAQAEKLKMKESEESTEVCSACGGTGHVAKAHVKDRAHPTAIKKAEAYASKVDAMAAAMKRKGFKPGTEPKDQVEEGKEHHDKDSFDANAKVGDTRQTKTGHTAKKTGPNSTQYTKNAPKKEKDDELDESQDEQTEKRAPTQSKETTYRDSKGKQHKSTVHKGWQAQKHHEKEEDKDLDESRLDEKKKPSAGLTAARKSAVVKKAKKGKDIGKPGKNFGKVAAKAAKEYGSKEAGEKVAAAAMWKNMKETTAYVMEKAKAAKGKPEWLEKAEVEAELKAGNKVSDKEKKKVHVKESTEVDRLREITGRLNQNERASTINESSDVNSIRALTKKLLG